MKAYYPKFSKQVMVGKYYPARLDWISGTIKWYHLDMNDMIWARFIGYLGEP